MIEPKKKDINVKTLLFAEFNVTNKLFKSGGIFLMTNIVILSYVMFV